MFNLQKEPFLVVVVLLLMAGAGTTQEIVFDPDSLNFGEVAIGTGGEPEGNQQVTLRNEGDLATTVWMVSVNPPELSEQFGLLMPAVAEARAAIRSILNAKWSFYQDYGEDPNTVAELRELGYLELDEALLDQWTFWLIGSNPVTEIEAVSTYRMPDGEGHVVLYDPETGSFYGYGEVAGLRLAAGESLPLTATFTPDSTQELTAELQVWWGDGEHCASIFATDSGYYADPIEVSPVSLDFGDVLLGERSALELVIRNTGRHFLECELEFQSDGFTIHDQIVDDVVNTILDIWTTAIRFNRERGEDPSSVEELVSEGYIQISEEVGRKWTFHLIGMNPIAQIEAVSTRELMQGAGHVMIFDLFSRRFTGFGHTHGDYHDTRIAVGREARLMVSFWPDEEGRVDAELTITAHVYQYIYSYDEEESIHISGNAVLAVSDVGKGLAPKAFSLSPAYPNPFNSNTSVTCLIPQAGWSDFRLLDIQGRSLGSWRSWIGTPGTRRIMVDGRGLAPGIYLLCLQHGGRTASTKLVLVK